MTSGVYRAIVRDVRDPASSGRIKVIIPAVSGDSETDWVWPVVPAGYVVLPKPGQQVWVLFEAGDHDNPVWLGAVKRDAAYDNLITRLTTLESQMTSALARLTAHGI
jgi:hypothetical protein